MKSCPIYLLLFIHLYRALILPVNDKALQYTLQNHDNILVLGDSKGTWSALNLGHAATKTVCTSNKNQKTKSDNCIDSIKVCSNSAELTLLQSYGADYFSSNYEAMELNFDAGTLRPVSAEYISNQTNYKELKSKFKAHSLSVIITISKEEYEFKFDTGYKGGLELPSRTKIDFSKQEHTLFQELNFPYQTDSDHKVSHMYHRSFGLNNVFYGTAITVNSSTEVLRFGMGIIKAFNWIIDYKNKKVYYLKNTISLDQFTNEPANKVGIYGARLIIYSKALTANATYDLGDIIASVEGQEINSGNICHFKKLLSSTRDWSALNIKIATK